MHFCQIASRLKLSFWSPDVTLLCFIQEKLIIQIFYVYTVDVGTVAVGSGQVISLPSFIGLCVLYIM